MKTVEGPMANESNVVVRRSVHAFLSFFVALLLFGCSEAASNKESIATQRDILTFPVTITLTSPSPVSPLTPVLGGSNSVSLGARAEIVNGMTVSMGNGGLQTQPDALLNETWSRGTANLRDRVSVRGTLHARTRVNGSNVVVTTWDQNPALDPIQTLSWKVTYPTGSADNITLNSGQSSVISPGKYGTITLNSQSTATFETGTYFLTSLILQSASVLRLNQSRGPVIIYVTDGVTLRTTIVPDSGTSPPDLLIAHLGTQAIFVESLFNGALIAPSASVTFRSVTGVHTGFFYAKDPVLDAGARVQYRAPLAIIGAAGKSGSSCKELAAAGGVPPADLHKYCTGCEIPTDSDRDGFEDCAESCDDDPDKTDPGICDCGTPDTDRDGDGTKDCMDPCDLDPNNVTPGQCGCLSSDPSVKAPVPAGKECTDTACGQTGITRCNGAGVCGSRGGCPLGCKLVENGGSSYWFCPGPVTQSAAVTACRSRGTTLVRINEFLENDFLQKVVTKPLWIGANSITTAGTWRWTGPTNNNGDQFWAGGVTGSQRNDLFSYWGTGAPAAQRCAVVRPGNGRWHAVDCNQALGYVCEFETPDSVPPPPRDHVPHEDRQPQPPLSTQCVTTPNSFLPTSPVEYDDAELAMLDHFKPAQDDADQGIFQGPAQSPPPDGGCAEVIDPSNGISDDSSTGWGCQFNPIPGSECTTDESCSGLGPNLLCREVKDPMDVHCAQIPEEIGDNDPICTGRLRCGTLTCPGHPPGVTGCQTIEVCDPEDEFTIDESGDSLESDEFNPDSIFDGGAPPVVQPSAEYLDDPVLDGTPQGKNHKWCFMNPQEDIEPVGKGNDMMTGNAKGGGKINFTFDPDLSFDADVNPLSMGETAMKVSAKAQLKTSVTLTNFIGATFTRDVLSAVAAIEAERCTLRTVDTEFAVFGADFLNIDQVPQFDTSDEDNDHIFPGDGPNGEGWFALTDKCEQTVGKAITMANRAKKAFRDAQQLLEQLGKLKDLGQNFDNLCESVMDLVGDGLEIPGFPDGIACPANEPPEITINRFLDYYQAPGFGQISQLRDSFGALRTTTAELVEGIKLDKDFGPKPFGETRTIVKGQFQIGPVPAVVEIGVFYSYGVNGYFSAQFQVPFDPFEEPPAQNEPDKPQRKPIATLRAGVMPYASAGVSAFVGVGKSLGPFSATLGIDGSVSLAVLRAPIFAGAGLGAEVLMDQRGLAPDIAAVLGPALNIPTHLGTPKSFKFFIWYEYGAALEANNILSGEVNGRLRIKFAFFSRTWKKRIVKFNGLGSRRVDLVSGKLGNDPGIGEGKGEIQFETADGKQATATTKTVSGTTDVGMSEATVPLLVLQPVDVPIESVEPENGFDSFKPEKVEGMFYDSLCCAKEGEECLMPNDVGVPGGKVPCCPGAVCRFDSNGTVCDVDCTPPGGGCTSSDQCCTAQGFDTVCSGDVCTRCGREGATCLENSDCCGSDTDPLIQCGEDNKCFRACEGPGGACAQQADCCPELNLACGGVVTPGACCGVTADGPGTGGVCEQDSDCCDYTGQQDSPVLCMEGPFGGGECQFVN